MRVVCIFLLLFSISCVSTQKLEQSQSEIKRLQADSALLEKRILGLKDQVNFLSDKSATIEQTLTNRLQEKEDSLNQKENLLKEKEMNLQDMKARKEQEREEFARLSQSIKQSFAALQPYEAIAYTSCAYTIIEVSDKLLFTPQTTKLDSKANTVMRMANEVLQKNADLKLIIINHTDSIFTGKEKWEDNWAIGSAKANACAKLLIKSYGVNPQRVVAATQAEHLPASSLGTNLGKARTVLMFYSELLPCLHGN